VAENPLHGRVIKVVREGLKGARELVSTDQDGVVMAAVAAAREEEGREGEEKKMSPARLERSGARVLEEVHGRLR
jgi:hypothetical protein